MHIGIVNINEEHLMFGFNIGGKYESILDTFIYIST